MLGSGGLFAASGIGPCFQAHVDVLIISSAHYLAATTMPQPAPKEGLLRQGSPQPGSAGTTPPFTGPAKAATGPSNTPSRLFSLGALAATAAKDLGASAASGLISR